MKKDPAAEAELLAARQRETMSIEERTAMFRNMLAEKEVSAFSTWEKELHKIVFDSRYLLLTSKDRKIVFEQYVKDRAEEERQEKRARYKKHREDFRLLLEEAKLTTRSSFSDFAHKNSKDERYKNIEKIRERENFFNDYISELRKREKDEKIAQRDKTKNSFIELLSEQNLNRSAKWSDVRENIRDDARYKAIDSSSYREDLFRTFVSGLAPRAGDEAAAAKESEDAKENEKKKRVEASIRERELEVARELSGHLRERDKEREQHQHAESVESYNALLADLVRSSDVSWREAKRLIKKDHRFELVDGLHQDEREELFLKHVEKLLKKKQEKFRELLEETKDISLTSEWRDVRRLIKSDPRYLKFSESDRKCEREFKIYMTRKVEAAKADYIDFLKETKILTYKTKKLIDESDQHLQEIIATLQNDKRHLILDEFAEDRRDMLMNYIKDLEKKGPPPPPTASEPVRRSTK